MATEAKTHYKKLFNPDYLGAYSLDPGQELVLTIASVATEKVKNADGREDVCMVAKFKENVKPMILNKTNAKTIAKVFQTPFIEDWAGKQIQVYAEKVKAFGDVVEALRVRPFYPKNSRLEKLRAEIRKAIPAYNGTDKPEILERLKLQYETGTETEQTLSEALKKLNS